MRLSTLLKELNIPCKALNEQEFTSLGLVGYNAGKKVCTFLTDEKYADGLSEYITMIITIPEIVKTISHKISDSCGVCIVDDPRNSFFKLHNYLAEKTGYFRKKFETEIGENSKISSLACISPNNVRIGKNVVIEEFVSIKENSEIGDNCIIRAGSVIGGEGFEFKKDPEGLFGVKHIGGVKIGNFTEVQQNSCVDKAIYPWDDTIVGDYVKIDNLCHIAHGAKIGDNTIIIAGSGIGGRTQIGREAWIGLGAVLRNGILVGENGRVNMGAVVTKSVPDGESVTGNFAIEHKKFIENMKTIR
ncbi:MAG: UDP-3-O-(3-hydroxymyristoyl)glucosamine N-acyltransferase [Firmicutes bacterium]|nr:UDP-3-O-(3-hydroxymyristoyl)glucosamine N-acyltransferase [Bacillota bacterium]